MPRQPVPDKRNLLREILPGQNSPVPDTLDHERCLYNDQNIKSIIHKIRSFNP
jgi:hypothetical protein